MDCDGVLIEDLPILNEESINICAKEGTIKGTDVDIVDNGACEEGSCPTTTTTTTSAP